MPLDATTASLKREIEAARTQLIAEARQAPDRWWPAWELKAGARNGWSAGAVTLALNRLIDDGTFVVSKGSVRLND